jgi:AbrB family looped-hinge helix DNA binding protein
MIMTATIQINQRGTLTLPKELRKRLGLEKGGVVIAEESSDGVILKPAVAFPIEMYSDSRIKDFEKEDEKLMVHLKKKSLKK